MIRRGSLRLRLFLAGAVAVGAVLALAAIGLSLLFDRHVERVAIADLDARAMALVAMVDPEAPDGANLNRPGADPQYGLPLSGHYWQIWIGDRLYRSRSLWDFTLQPEQPAPRPGALRVERLKGPQGDDLLAIDRSFIAGGRGQPSDLRVIVAMHRAQLNEARRAFLGDLLPYLGLLGLLFLAASFVQVTVGLRPLGQIGSRVSALARGQRQRMGDDLPQEVVPLANQIDALLDARQAVLQRARHRAADLAHGFKTPLQALMGNADELRRKGEQAMAEDVESLVGAMRGVVDRELTRARIQSDHAHSATVPGPVIQKLLDLMRRMPRGRELDWRLDVQSAAAVRIDQHDLTEALGAVLENAMGHAASQVVVTVADHGDQVAITIVDDGLGVPGDLLDRLVDRGMSLDESGGGQGFGLSIVADIAEAAQGELQLSNALPGLAVCLRLPRK